MLNREKVKKKKVLKSSPKIDPWGTPQVSEANWKEGSLGKRRRKIYCLSMQFLSGRPNSVDCLPNSQGPPCHKATSTTQFEQHR